MYTSQHLSAFDWSLVYYTDFSVISSLDHKHVSWLLKIIPTIFLYNYTKPNTITYNTVVKCLG